MAELAKLYVSGFERSEIVLSSTSKNTTGQTYLELRFDRVVSHHDIYLVFAGAHKNIKYIFFPGHVAYGKSD